MSSKKKRRKDRRPEQPHEAAPAATVTPVIQPKTEIIIVLSILCAALIVRVLYFVMLKGTPFFEPLAPKLDDGIYYAIAHTIREGNWLADVPLSAYRVPLYPYFLALMLRFFGEGYAAVHVVQALIGCLTPVLVYGLTRAAFGSVRTAMIAGILIVLYLPLVFYENMLLGESLSIFFILAGMLLLIRSHSRRAVLPVLILSGLCTGIAILFRPNALVPAACLTAAIYVLFGLRPGRHKQGILRALVFAFAIGLALAPVTLRNYVLHKDFLPVTALGGVNLYIGNNPQADGKFSLAKGIGTSFDAMVENSVKTAEAAEGRTLKPSEVSSYWVNRAVDFAAKNPGFFIQKTLLKMAYAFNRYEFPDVVDITFAAKFLPILGMSPVGYGVLALFGLLGFFLALRRGGEGKILIDVFVAGYLASVVLFFVTSRYRLPLAPFLAVYAAFAVNRIWEFVRSGNTGGLILSAVILGAAAIVVFQPVEKVNFATNYNSLAIAMKNKGNFEEAERYYLKAMETDPYYPSPHYNYALLLQEMNRMQESQAEYTRFKELAARAGLGEIIK